MVEEVGQVRPMSGSWVEILSSRLRIVILTQVVSSGALKSKWGLLYHGRPCGVCGLKSVFTDRGRAAIRVAPPAGRVN